MRTAAQQVSVPPHLGRYVVEQDYEQYSEIDHAVWRFVLLQTYAQQKHTAHPAYRSGLAATGIDIERIPRIADMNEKLSRFGWGAVCVDGFIPPRAFQAFQANRILPIAAEIRSRQHLAYTPAPDIIHEAAGHAPIISDPEYADFLQSIGRISERAFTLKTDREVYAAFHTLAEVKESPSSSPEQVARADAALRNALSLVTGVSESARLSRLYWWTSEYGLVGKPDDYRVYGAGLLSSLGEGHSCHAPYVTKLPLSAACLEVDYDITRPQPQLFVARDFAQLHEVLDEVSETLAFRRGDAYALDTALKSEELATLTLDSGLSLTGVVSSLESMHGQPALVGISGAPMLSRSEKPLQGLTCPNELLLPLGKLAHGRPLSALSPEILQDHVKDGTLSLRLQSGIHLTGTLLDHTQHAGLVDLVLLAGFVLTHPDGRVFRAQARYPLPLANNVLTARAGAPDECLSTSAPPKARVPHPRWFSAEESEILALYERAQTSMQRLGGEALVQAFEAIAVELRRNHPSDWLLRFHLLEGLARLGEGEALSAQLCLELEALEIRHLHREPIATGLAYVRNLFGHREIGS